MDNTSLQIERLAYEMKSYKEALIHFQETYLPDCDFEDILPTLHPNLVAKIRQEFIDKKYIPHLRQTSIMDFLKD